MNKKKVLKFISISFVVCIILSSCQKENFISDESTQETENNLITPSISQEIILGQQIGNSFSVDNMKLAYQKIGLKSKADNLEANALYVKLLPANADDISKIETDTNLVIFDFPLDYEIIQEGDYYIEPGIVDTFLNPRYVIVKEEEELPDMPYEIKDELYVPDNEKEGEAIVWAMILNGEIEVPIDKDTIQVVDENKGGWYPNLRICINNTNTPLQNMKIRIGAYYYTTNTNGNLTNIKKHYGKITVYGRFENSTVTVRKGIAELTAIDRYDQIATVNETSNQITLTITSANNSDMWNKASCFEAVRRYNVYCSSNGISQVSNINLWSLPVAGGAACPLFHVFDNVTTTFFKSFAESFVLGTSFTITFIANLIGSNLEPDIIIGNFSLTQGCELLVFHELSHYSHAIRRGKTFWHNVVEGEIGCMTLAGGDPYGDGTQPTQNLANYIGLAESWANFMEATIGNFYGYGTSDEDFFPRTIPYTPSRDWRGWFPVGVYWDILDNTPNDEIILRDNSEAEVRRGFDVLNGQGNGIAVSSLYNLITNSSCNSVVNFKTLFNNQYPALITQSNALFLLYGY